MVAAFGAAEAGWGAIVSPADIAVRPTSTLMICKKYGFRSAEMGLHVNPLS